MIQDLFGNRPLLVLSDGLGVDTGALKVLIMTDDRFAKYRPDYMVHVDTGAEMPYTYEIVEPTTRQWMVKQGYPDEKMIVIDCDDPDFSPPSKRGAMDEWFSRQAKPGIPTRVYRSCTDGGKIAKFNIWLNDKMDLRRGKWKNYGQRHRVMIGIAADETSRVGEEPVISRVMDGRDYIEYVYPLIEFGITRQDCFEILGKAGLPALKSGCFFCPFQPLAKFWAVKELYPQAHARSVAMESKAMAHNPKLSLVGKPGVTIDQAIDGWVEKQSENLPDPWETLTSDYKLDRCW